MGLKYRLLPGTGIIAFIEGAQPGKNKLLRADIDGLPVQEEEVNLSGHEKVDSCITNAISKPKNRIFDQCLSNLSRDASYIMVADMDKVAENIEQYSPYIPGFICDNIGLFRSFIISSQVTEINGRYSHIYVFTYKD